MVILKVRLAIMQSGSEYFEARVGMVRCADALKWKLVIILLPYHGYQAAMITSL